MARYIDAEEVKHIMNEYITKTGCDIFTKYHLTDFLHEASSKDIIKIVHAKWLVDEDEGLAICSNCKEQYSEFETDASNYYRFCPNCGAKMGEEK